MIAPRSQPDKAPCRPAGSIRRGLAAAASAIAALVCVAAGPPADPGLASRALELLDGETLAAGPLELAATVTLGGGSASRADLVPASLDLLLPAGAPAGGRLDLVVVLASFELEPTTLGLTERLPPPPPGQPAMLRVLFEAPEEVDRIVVAAALEGVWGAVDADLDAVDADPQDGEAPVALATWDLRPGGSAAVAPPVLRLLPPFDQPVTGRARIRVLISDPAVARVAFELDGRPAGEDAAPPFAAELDFGADGAVHEVRAVAYDGAGRALGEDRLAINDRTPGNRVRIDDLAVGVGTIGVTARLEFAGAAPATSMDFYLNEERQARLTAPPWQFVLSRPDPRPDDFVRVVARFADGEELEDARLVEGAAERVEVNLVQVFAVVTDRDGAPQRDLTREDFVLRLAGREQAIDRFAPAEQVPLVLGLVIDTSGSMWTLMPDTRQAGASFLVDTMRTGDRAFLVDFDTRPRLAAGLTGDVTALLRRFNELIAEGYTAMYDAVIFSMLQFEREPGRKALVVLTDGDDYKSRFGARRCIEYGRELGVPVYIIALGGMFGERRDIKKLDLESLAGSTGGRVFYIQGSQQQGGVYGGGPDSSYSAELAAAYDLIQQELRSQYLLAFNSPRPLSPDELGKIKVEVRPRGLRVRAVAGVD